MVDNGYDISDYMDSDPSFGTMEDMKELIAEAKKRGIRILDVYKRQDVCLISKGEDTISPNGLRIVTILLPFETSIPTALDVYKRQKKTIVPDTSKTFWRNMH